MDIKNINSKDIADLIRTFAFENPQFYCIEGSFKCKGQVVEYKITNKDKLNLKGSEKE